MNVLFATSEFAGLAKAGGLGDVSAGLPRALRHRGIDARVLMPAYSDVLASAGDITIQAMRASVPAPSARSEQRTA